MFYDHHRPNVSIAKAVTRIAVAAALLGGTSLAFAPQVFAAGDFYKGKTFTVMVASRAGGGTDTTARLVARFWGDYIPGKPKVLVRNKGLQVIAANELHNKIRPNGLIIGVFAGGGTLGPFARKSSSVRYDPRKWGFAGSIERGPSIQLFRKSAPSGSRIPRPSPSPWAPFPPTGPRTPWRFSAPNISAGT